MLPHNIFEVIVTVCMIISISIMIISFLLTLALSGGKEKYESEDANVEHTHDPFKDSNIPESELHPWRIKLVAAPVYNLDDETSAPDSFCELLYSLLGDEQMKREMVGDCKIRTVIDSNDGVVEVFDDIQKFALSKEVTLTVNSRRKIIIDDDITATFLKSMVNYPDLFEVDFMNGKITSSGPINIQDTNLESEASFYRSF